MLILGWTLVALPFVLAAYTYAGYPLLLKAWAGLRQPAAPPALPPAELPYVSISLPVYNEEAQVRGVIESLLRLDYPAERLQILVVSDASSDGTDDIVRTYADRGVELLRMPKRSGKTAAENAAAPLLRGEIVVNTDASIRILPGSLKPLVAWFADATVGVASGRDVSVTGAVADGNTAEGGYVGYEMGVRALETRTGGIIGASGCFYAIRAELHRVPLKDSLSRDFSAALIAEEHGFRAVSVDQAVCLVPRTGDLQREYRRKVRTITRGMETLLERAHLLNPFAHGAFAWKLWSHKICRWLVPWTLVTAAAGMVLLAMTEPWARLVLAAGAAAALVLAASLVLLPPGARPRRLASAVVFTAAGNIAAVHATLRLLHGDRDPTWEPTRRDAVAAP
jgi:cellulose synthase/poly-beta-1,6-N-acetylglucosamine synthase-like glycosyltransferase